MLSYLYIAHDKSPLRTLLKFNFQFYCTKVELSTFRHVYFGTNGKREWEEVTTCQTERGGKQRDICVEAPVLFPETSAECEAGRLDTAVN